jgi:hypothetical protein
VIPRVLSERARDLREHGEPFVTATVVRTQKPTSAQAGNVALVHRDGTIEGFVGGVCAQHSVRLYSLQAIETGQPLLLRIMPDVVGGATSSRVRTAPSRSATRACRAARWSCSSSPSCRRPGCWSPASPRSSVH